MVKYLGAYRLLGIASSLMVAAYVTIAILLHRQQSLDPGIWVNSLVEFQFFALGTIIAIGLRGRAPRFSHPLRWLLFAAGLLCLRGAQAAVYIDDPSLPHDFLHIAPGYMLALLGCLGLFFSLLHATRGKLQRPLIYLGKISYGLYVYHIVWLGLFRDILERLGMGRLPRLTFQLSEMALALPATIATAMLSYRYLESPFLRFKKRFTLVSSRPV
jgi:peptidoglycan/LPS O-acetylase OafA/YrhL